MDYQEFPAPAPCDRLIACVWFLTGRGEHYSPQPVVPDGRLELLVHLGDPFSRLDRDGSIHRQAHLLAAGQLSGPIHLAPGNWIDVVGVRLTPAGAHAVLPVSLDQLSNHVVSLREVHRGMAAALETAATRPLCRAGRARLMVKVLAQYVREEPDARMTAALEFLAEGGPGSFDALAARCGMSWRTLERRFLREVGLTPKTYQRVVRFRRAFRMLGETGPGAGARIAARAGYYDQAHLIRDFRRFAGASPSSFFRATTALARAFSTANHGATKEEY
jgi:AraC-like DNA-binding protein